MDSRSGAYLRERRKLSGAWNATPRVFAGLIGAALAAMAPLNPTTSQNIIFTVLKAVGGVVIVETVHFLYRFIWIAPKAMYFDALRRAELGEMRAAADVRVAEAAAARRIADVEKRCTTKLQVFTTNISTLQRENAALEVRLHREQTLPAVSPFGAENARMATEQYRALSPDARAAIRHLLIAGDATDQQVFVALTPTGDSDRDRKTLARIAQTTDLVRRVDEEDTKQVRLFGYNGPYRINGAFRATLQQLVADDVELRR